MSKTKRPRTPTQNNFFAIVVLRVLKTKRPRTPTQNNFFAIVVLSLIIGFFALAWVDKDIRLTFADLAKVGVGGYIALMVPSESDRRDSPK